VEAIVQQSLRTSNQQVDHKGGWGIRLSFGFDRIWAFTLIKRMKGDVARAIAYGGRRLNLPLLFRQRNGRLSYLQFSQHTTNEGAPRFRVAFLKAWDVLCWCSTFFFFSATITDAQNNGGLMPQGNGT